MKPPQKNPTAKGMAASGLGVYAVVYTTHGGLGGSYRLVKLGNAHNGTIINSSF